MLNSQVALGERGLTPPIGVGWQGSLWLSYQRLDTSIAVRRVDIDSPDVVGTSTVAQLPWSCERMPAIAVWSRQLWLAFVAPVGQLTFATSDDGSQFVATGTHALPTSGDIAMFATRAGLIVAWHEDAGPLHLTRTYDGANLEDFVLDGSAGGPVSLAYEEGQDRLVLGWTAREGGVPQVSRIDLTQPQWQLVPVDLPNAQPARSVAVATVAKYGARTIAVLEDPKPGSSFLSEPIGRTILDPSGVAGGPERGGFAETIGVRLTSFQDRVYVTWRDDSDQLGLAPYDLAFGLPQELVNLIGTECDPLRCPPDPRLTCAATSESSWIWDPAKIINARRGDIIMTPADGAGLIGTLLQAVTPPQYMDHMGVMVRDQYTVRHSTMAHARVKCEDYYEGSVLGVQPAPTDGLRGDLVKYGWPGTITQQIEDAFYTGFNSWSDDPADPPHTSLNPRWDYFAFHPQAPHPDLPAPGAPAEDLEAYNRTRLFNDPERTDDQYPIHNMPNVPQYLLSENRLLHGVVVKPSPALEARDPEIRASLDRVATAAEQIKGHYRFFAYSQAGIARDPNQYAPPSGDPYWAGKPAGADWSAGTPPTVCSSFLWAAVQLANADDPQLILEGSMTESADELLGNPPVDGLYRYTAQERHNAAQALTTLLASGVRAEVRAKLGSLQDEFLWVSALARYGVIALNALLLGPTAVALAALGCTSNQLADLALLLNDMPDDIANQMANVFAYDEERNIDDDHWKNAPDGLAVSPDDIRNFWDKPTGLDSDGRIRFGLWGDSQDLLLVEPRPVLRIKHVYAKNDGLARVHGVVRYRGDPVEGAEVRIGCERAMTGPIGGEQQGYTLEVSSGQQEVKAGAYWPGSSFWLTSSKVMSVTAGDQRIDIDLVDPPEWRRIIRIYGRLDLVHQVLVGHDDWIHQPITFEARLAWTPIGQGPPFPTGDQKFWSSPWLSDLAGNERVHFTLTVALQEDLSVDCGLSVQLLQDFYGREDEDVSDHIETGINIKFSVAADTSHKRVVDQKSNDVPPDRAHLELTVQNDRAPA
jgi:hypothetical protein